MLFWHNLWPDLFYTLKKSLTICIPFVNSDNLPPYHICTYIIFTFNASLRKYARTWRNTFIPSGRKIQKVIGIRFSRTKIIQIFPYSDKRMFIVNLENSTEFRQQVNAEYTDTFTILWEHWLPLELFRWESHSVSIRTNLVVAGTWSWRIMTHTVTR